MRIQYLLLFILPLVLSAQNSPSFFKTIPPITEQTPAWAKMMYQSNPNVAEVEDAFRAYYKTHPFEKTIHTQNHKHWIRIVEPLLDTRGFIVQKTKEEGDAGALQLRQKRMALQGRSILGSNNEWVPMGPFETFKANTTQAISWHKNVYSMDQSIADPNLIICGTESGGVYLSTDKAQNWTLISKNEIFSGSNAAVKIHPTNVQHFLVASNNRIYQSLDGGQTWNDRFYTGGTGNEFKFSSANPNIVFHTNTQGLFKSIDAGLTWTQVFTETCWDIDFHKADANTIYLLKTNTTAKRAELFRSDDMGQSWTIKDSAWYVPTDMSFAQDIGGKIALTAAAPDLVYVVLIGESKQDDNGWIGLYKSSNKGELWTNPSGQDGGPYNAGYWNVAAYSSGYHQGYYNFDAEASDLDSNRLWIGTVRLTESSDGGQTFQSIGGAGSIRLDDIHADIQDIEVQGNDVWVASDGGINYSSDELQSHVALNRGILAADFWGFNTGWNEDSYTGGKYHDGTSGWFEAYGIGNAYNIGGVEEASGYVHPIEGRKMYFRTHYNSANTSVKTIPLQFGDQIKDHPSLPIRPNEHYWTAERSGVYFDPRYANHILVALENTVYKSTNGGATFDTLFTFPNASGMVYEMEIARSNPNVIYAVYNSGGGYYDNCILWKSINGGQSFAPTSTVPSNRNRRFRISVDPSNHDHIWLCVPRGSSGGRVFSSLNGGSSWMNRSTSTINAYDVMDILYQGGTDDVVYVVSRTAAHYWDKSTGDWVDYSLGLPLIPKSLQVNPFYRDAELRLASARGVWARFMADTSFRPIAQPITHADKVYCPRDTVQLDCYSILKHKNASWTWNIQPAPLYISSTTARNPRVVFGNAGKYTVSLTVKDAQGNSDTKRIPDMIEVFDYCQADSVVGKALTLKDDGDYFVTDVETEQITHFTVSAWIKPDSIQEGFAGILSDGEWCAHCDGPVGFIFDYYGRELHFKWPGSNGNWWGSSNLEVPIGEWSYVAMVVQPGSVTMYLNEEQWMTVDQLDTISLNTLYAGKGHYNNHFKGQIDELTTWKRALSEAEIREWRHLTKDAVKLNDPQLLSYYQFNRVFDGEVADNGGLNHGYISGGAKLDVSTAPVGPGKVERVQVNSSGLYGYPHLGMEIYFDNVHPTGEIVISRLNVLPDSLPNNNPSIANYWIVNNYGTKNFDPLKALNLQPFNAQAYGQASDAGLWYRRENAHLNDWQSSCVANAIQNNSYEYDATCQLTNTYQFFVQSQNVNAISKSTIYATVDTTICANDSILLSGSYQNTTGTYTDTFALSASLDSVITTNLQVLATSFYVDNQQACSTYTWIDGQTYTSSNNTATYVLTNQVGCDSVIQLDLIVDALNTQVQWSGDSLFARQQQGVQYQWLDCNANNSPIQGANTAVFKPVASGYYAVAMTKGTCTDTSACTLFTKVGVMENSIGEGLRVFPIPTKGPVYVELGKVYSKVHLTLYDVAGKVITDNHYEEVESLDFILDLPAGVYMLDIKVEGDKNAKVKLIKK